MPFLKKIVIFIIIATSVAFIVTSIPLQKEWKHGFINTERVGSTAAPLKHIEWENRASNHKITIPENREKHLLVLSQKFIVKDINRVISVLLKYDHRFATEIYLNEKKCAVRDRHLIEPASLNNETHQQIEVFGYGSKRVFLKTEEIADFLVEGKNTIHIVVTNLEEINSFRLNKIELHVIDGKTETSSNFFTGSKLPIISINTNDTTIPDEPKIKASLNLINGNDINTLSDSSAFFNIKIEVRGNTSQSFAKQSYSFNIYDSNFVKHEVSLLGLPPSKKWVLQGPYADKSLIRNPLTYSLYRQMGNYAPKTAFVDLIINDNYRGIYVLTEKIQVGEHHLNIPKLIQDTTNIDQHEGGYLLEIDRGEWQSNYPPKSDTSAHPLSYSTFVPKKEQINPVLEQKIRSQFDLFEQQLYNNKDPFEHLDIHSFVDYFIITELTRNTDGYCLSTFLYNKNINSSTPKFYIGPIWDYNLTFGLADYRDSFNPQGFVYNSSNYIPFWWDRLLNNVTFKDALHSRYASLRSAALSNENINSTIDSLSSICKNSSEINFKKWNFLGGAAPWPNYYTGRSYQDEIDYLKNWTEDRLIFLDKEFKNEQP